MVDIEAGIYAIPESHRKVAAAAAAAAGSEDNNVETSSKRPRHRVEDHKKIAVEDPLEHASPSEPSSASSSTAPSASRPSHARSVSLPNGSSTTSNNNRQPLATIMANKAQQQQANIEPKLIHPILSKVPLQFRFGVTGLMSNVMFMVAYNMAVDKITQLQPSVLYAIVYFFFIPASHLMVSLFVFGWPERYLKSLMSNFPIGLTALAIGGVMTAYLDRAGFNQYVANYIRDFSTFSTMPARNELEAGVDKEGEFYSSLLVLFVTSVWTYILSVYVNSPPARSQKKDL